MGTLSVRLFGAPEILDGDRAVAVDTRKAIAVLAVLAVDRRAVRRDTLAALLWPEASQDRARGTLRRTLSSLRTALGADRLLADRETGRSRGFGFVEMAKDDEAARNLGEILRGFVALAKLQTGSNAEMQKMMRMMSDKRNMMNMMKQFKNMGGGNLPTQ